MATYEYRCARHRAFTVAYPIGEAARSAPCPSCGAEADRVWSAPALARTPRRLAAAVTQAERSAEIPDVVSAVPGRHRQGHRARRTRRQPRPRPAAATVTERDV